MTPLLALLSLLLVLSPFAVAGWLSWTVGNRRACFEETVNRTMPVVDGVRQPPTIPTDPIPFDRVVRRSMRATMSKLQGEDGEDLPAWR